MLIAMFAHLPSVVYAEQIYDIVLSGESVEHVILADEEKQILSISNSYFDGLDVKYQWQILLDEVNDIWVDIYDKKEKDCEISYAVVKHMLNDENQAFIRCKIIEDDVVEYSGVLCVEIDFFKDDLIEVQGEAVLLSDVVVLETSESKVEDFYETIEIEQSEDCSEEADEVFAEDEDTELVAQNNDSDNSNIDVDSNELSNSDDEEIKEDASEKENQDESADLFVSEDAQINLDVTAYEEVDHHEDNQYIQVEYEQNEENQIDFVLEQNIELTSNEHESASVEENEEEDINIVSDESVEVLEIDLMAQQESDEALAYSATDFESQEVLFALRSTQNEISQLDLDDSAEYVNITIKYLDKSSINDSEASIYSPYIATVEKGATDFYQAVLSPTFLGFSPKYDSDNMFVPATSEDAIIDSAEKIILDFDVVNEDITIYVYYVPIKVDFAVRYFFQNINDDLYTEDANRYLEDTAETGTIISDDYLKTNAGDTTGFEKMYHKPEAVAADGSTVFECYYDRNYYLIKFNLDGGFGLEPIYARYDTPFVIAPPVKPGYVFVGWDLLTEDTDSDGQVDTGDGNQDTIPSTIPAQNLVYKAIWQTINADYTVVYWKENADDNGFSYWGSAVMEAESGTYVSGSDNLPDTVADGEREYFSYCDWKTDKDVLIMGNGSSIVNVYYTRNYYTINFTGYGKCGLEVHSHGDGTCNSTLICTLEQHEHTAECNKTLICPIEEHIHSENSCGCSKTQHTAHEKTCYQFSTNDTSISNNAVWWGDVLNSQTPNDNGIVYYYGNYYVKLGTSWYQINNWRTNTSVSLSCNGLHTHDTGDCTYQCGKQAHQHSTEMCYSYSCGKTEHVHSEALDCYSACTKQVHTHSGTCNSNNTSNVIHTLTAKYEQNIASLWPTYELMQKKDNVYKNNQNQVVGSSNGSNEFTGWTVDDVDSTATSKRVTMTSDLCDTSDGIKIGEANYSSNINTVNLYYMFESFDQTSSANGKTRKLYKGIYYELDTDYYQTVKATSSELRQKDITGMKKDGVESERVSNKVYDNFLYYSRRDDLVLTFQSLSNTEKTVSNLMYEYPLKDFEYVEDFVNGKYKKDAEGNYYEVEQGTGDYSKFEPDYPSTLEPNAYYFDKWFETADCYPGTEYDFEHGEMPNGNLTLYAHWVEEVHDVILFTTYDEMIAYQNGEPSIVPYKTFENVTHGHTVGSIPNPTYTDSSGMELIFSGWFFIENGQKKAFHPLEIPIKGDMQIYADWSSKLPQPYLIQYVLKSNPSVKVANDTTGFAYGGSTRTFTAKTGEPYNQLYETYKQGYFPTIGSHSVVIQYEPDKEHPVNNVFTFYYLEAANIPYTIRHVNSETGEVMATVTKTTSNSVVTERFKVFPNMVPDAFYKRLVISVEEKDGTIVGTEDNVITFYYTRNETSAYYAVHFMKEKLNATESEKLNYAIDGSGGYEEVGTHIEGIGNVNSTIAITPTTFAGFDLIKTNGVAKEVQWTTNSDDELVSTVLNKNLTSGGDYQITIKPGGTELYIFYSRKQYDYVVHYYEYNTTNKLAPDKTGSSSFESSFAESSIKIDGYTCVTAQDPQTITIRDNSVQTKINEIIFYYAPVQYTVTYLPIPGDVTSVWTTPRREIINGTESFSGSIPECNKNYEFVGWYLDKECVHPVTSEYAAIDSETNKLVPKKEKLSDKDENIFYAKFRRLSGDLVIIKPLDADDDQEFIYEIRNVETNKSIFVCIKREQESVVIHDLMFGEYEIIQKNNWSWRYSSSNATIDPSIVIEHNELETLVENFKDDLLIRNTWLSGNSENYYVNRKEE